MQPETSSSDGPPPRVTLDYATPPRRSHLKRLDSSIWLSLFIILLLLAGLLWLVWPASTGRGPGNPQVFCAMNLRQIGLAALMYANESGGAFPEKVEQLLLTQDVTPNEFFCPSSGDTPAPGTTPQAQAANLSAGGHLSYVYIGQGLTDSVARDTILAFEPIHHHGAGMNVLFADSSVEFFTQERALKLLYELSAGHNPPRPEMIE